MTEDYIKIYCDRCGKEALVRKARFPDCIAGCCISDSERWSLKDKCAISDLCPQCRCEYEKMLHKFYCEGVKRNG